MARPAPALQTCEATTTLLDLMVTITPGARRRRRVPRPLVPTLALLLATAVRAHVPPVADIDIALEGSEALIRIATIDQLMATWLDLRLEDFAQTAPRQASRVRARAQRFVDRESTLLLNGAPVQAVVEAVEVTEHEYDVIIRRMTTIVLHYQGQGRVRSLALQWRALRGIEVLNASFIEGTLKGFGEERSFKLSRGNDTLIWRTREDRTLATVLTDVPGRTNTASLDVEIDDGAVTCVAYLPLPSLRASLPLSDDLTIAKQDLEQALQQVRAFYERALAVHLDDMLVRPIAQHVETEFVVHGEARLHLVKTRLRFPAPGPPRRVAVAWRSFDAAAENTVLVVPLRISASTGELTGELSPGEPELIWHAARGDTDTAALVLDQAATTSTAPMLPRTRRSVPALSAALVLLTIGLVLLLRSRVERRVLYGAGVLGLALAVALQGVGRIEVPGLALGGAPRVEPGQAQAIFRTLLLNNYRAFDYSSEDEVYDTLAQSVTGELLREVYVDIHESLIQREQGGAVSRVQAVDIVHSDVSWPTKGAASQFTVSCRWRVKGTVEHWGHAHTRVNEYLATFGVRQESQGWRISAMDVLDQQRVVDGGTGAPPDGAGR